MGAFIRTDDFSETMAQVYDLFPILKEKRFQAAGELSGGQRQQVAVGRALMTKPKVLMLDEPTAGVSPIVMDELFDRIIEVARTGIPILRDKRGQAAGELSGGQRQQVAVGRALMTRPKVLMLDEPTAGVSPIVMDELFDRIIEVARTGLPVMMVEQNARQALEIADQGYVLVQGRNAHTGTGTDLLGDAEVRQSFLGG